MTLRDFSVAELRVIVSALERYKNKRLRIKFRSAFIDKFIEEDPYDKTTVFDFIDDNWCKYVYSHIQKVSISNLYKGDGTLEYRIAYICVEINLLHQLPNGNKRSSILVFWILLLLNCKNKIVNLDNDELYEIAKRTASEGTQNREQNIEMLKEYIQSL